ncbi:hypothetical protein [Haloplanus halophilus]|uniref:hypothetical protein n=1 Tax=Haloplanus halophilus TaxID=2949993 RepID=UPI0020406080|nr:hypothetical protein [Haloplanus sp. GDY1]
MPEEAKGAITSDKVETDNTNFATVRADQTCEEVLVPRENAYRQLNWQVTLEKGSIYKPQEDVGIYADEVDCKYGVQIRGDVFGRSAVSLEHGGAVHSGADDGESAPVVGARVVGSVVSEGQVDVTAPGSRMDDWEPRPVQVYGDVIGDHVTIEEPTVVYGTVSAETTLRANAPLVVVGDVRSEGIVEASDLVAVSVSARDDVTLGHDVAVVNPEIRSDEGTLTIADRVGILTPELLEHVRANNDVDAVGPWVFDVDAVWEGSALVPADVSDHGQGQIADRAWRTVEEPTERRAKVRKTVESMIERTRKHPPDIEEFRYASVGSVGGTEITVEGDVVAGDQRKTVDESTTAIDRSTEVHDESTTVEDSVVNRSDIAGDEPEE